jgi:hypothetical protein
MRSKRMSSLFSLTLSALFVGMSAGGAHAYLDPGTGSMILQVLLGGIAGLAIVVKLYWYRFRAMLGIAPKPSPRDAETGARSNAQAD